MMRVLVVGAGAVGGYFGGRLAEVGRDVTFLLRPARAEQIERNGLQIVSQHGDACLRVPIVQTGTMQGAYDVILLATKAYGLDQAIIDFQPAVGDHTVIVPILNGMRHMDVLTEKFGSRRVLGGLCGIAASIDSDGRIVQSMVPVHEIVFGELDGIDSDRVQQIAALFEGAKCDARVSSTIVLDMWQKWIWLATLAGITCLMRASLGDIGKAPGGREATLGLLEEAKGLLRLTVTNHELSTLRTSVVCSLRRDRLSRRRCCVILKEVPKRKANMSSEIWRPGTRIRIADTDPGPCSNSVSKSTAPVDCGN